MQQALKPAACCFDFLFENSAVAFKFCHLLAQLPVFVAQLAAQIGCLTNLVFKRGEFSVHSCNIV